MGGVGPSSGRTTETPPEPADAARPHAPRSDASAPRLRHEGGVGGDPQLSPTSPRSPTSPASPSRRWSAGSQAQRHNGDAGATEEPGPASSSQLSSFHEQYVLLGKLGKGAFASVYLTRPAGSRPTSPDSDDTGPECVAKVIDLQVVRHGEVSYGEINPKLRRAAEKEAHFLRVVSGQEHCVSLLDFSIEDTLAYIVMEKCDATLLKMLERQSTLRESTLTRVFTEMSEAVRAVHGLRVVHRDVKPDNFLCVGEQLTVKLCDFGLAESEAPKDGECRGLSGVYGTAPFMSPEMLSGDGYGSRTDVWSLGVIMYVICLGQFPYIPAKSSTSAMKAAIVAGMPPPTFKPKTCLDLSNGSPISECLKDLMRAMLDRDPTTRLSSEAVLQHPWFRPGAERAAFPLRPMLYSAKRAGAFDCGGAPPEDTLDVRLKMIQARYHQEGLAALPTREERKKAQSQQEGGGGAAGGNARGGNVATLGGLRSPPRTATPLVQGPARGQP